MTEKQVHDALNRAAENEYDFKVTGESAEQIAWDLMEYDAEFEGCDDRELIPHIESWLNRSNK